MRGEWEKFAILSRYGVGSEIGGTLWRVQVKHYTYLAASRLAPSGD